MMFSEHQTEHPKKLTKKKRFADIQNNDKAAALLNFAETKNK